MTVLEKLREVHRLRGDTFSSYEVIGLIGQAIAEIEGGDDAYERGYSDGWDAAVMKFGWADSQRKQTV